jgi:putative ABC transport system permease protein
MDLRDADPERKQLLRQELKRLSSVESASISFSLPGSGMLQGQKLVSQFVPQAAKDAGIRMMTIDEDYLNTYGISLVEGRMLSNERKTDETAFLINEAAKKYFGWNDISGKMTGYYKFSYRADGTYEEIPFTGEVVGVIKDYHHANLKAPIEPMILALNSGMEGQMGIRLKAGAIESGLGQLEAVWKKVFPDRPFEYAFLDNIFNQNYRSDQRTGTILGIFSILAIFISLLGLFGLVAHQSIERKKEIAIRRVLGADISEVLRLLSREFTVLMMFASLLAFPIAWFGMNKWLENYAYRIDFPLWVFPVSMLAMAILALTTISLQVFRVSLSKPVASITNDR